MKKELYDEIKEEIISTCNPCKWGRKHYRLNKNKLEQFVGYAKHGVPKWREVESETNET